MNLFITVGVPGSGKTTWAKEKARQLGNTLTVSRDDIRRTLYCAGGDLTGYRFTEEKEKLVTQMQTNIVLSALGHGKNVIVLNQATISSGKNSRKEQARSCISNTLMLISSNC